MEHQHHHTHADPSEHLQSHGVKPTAVRILVWNEVQRHHRAFSLPDMEQAMPSMDRSSIFRALRLFVSAQLLHEIDDGTGHQKYCVCRCEDSQHLGHVHFTCLRCGTTYCLDQTSIPTVTLPEGFVMQEEEFVVKGICPRCQ